MTTPKKIAIIGNAPSKIGLFKWRNHSIQLIKDADIIIRFNFCNSLGLATGFRTDILGLINRGTPANELALGKRRLNKYVERTLTQVWFSRPSRENWECDVSNQKIYELPEDVSDKIIEKITSKNNNKMLGLDYINPVLFKHLLAVVNPNGNFQYEPSSGFSIINMLLNNFNYTGCKINLFNFTWEGWHGHNWGIEKEYIYALYEKGQVGLII